MSDHLHGGRDQSKPSRFAEPATFARLPGLDQVDRADVALVGVPFDSGSLYRVGARFGPSAARQASQRLRQYNPGLGIEPFTAQRVVDAGDVFCTPFDIECALSQITDGVGEVLRRCNRVVAIGGDHTVSLGVLRAVEQRYGPVAIIHFDAHLDTLNSCLGSPYCHGTSLRRAIEEGLVAPNRSIHVGLHGPISSSADLEGDGELGFRQVHARHFADHGATSVAEEIRERIDGCPVYVSVDLDVLDPAFAPGVGSPEFGGLSSRELLETLHSLRGIPIASADVVELCPPYDHAEITALAAANIAYELLGLISVATV